jgi:hypothetical protein
MSGSDDRRPLAPSGSPCIERGHWAQGGTWDWVTVPSRQKPKRVVDRWAWPSNKIP